jgi:hypothetical protein
VPLQNALGDLALDATLQSTNTRLSAFQQIMQPLQRIAQLLKPLGVVTNATNRLNVDINNIVGGTINTVTTVGSITTLPTLSTVTTVGTVSNISAGTLTTIGTLTNQAQIGTINAFAQIHDISRQGYTAGIRGKVS